MNLYDYVTQDFINKNQFSRPGTKRNKTTKLVWHYTANPGASDTNHQLYFDGLKNQNPNDGVQDTYASAHIFIDKDSGTEIIPIDEKAYHASQANEYSIGIELCIEKDGTFHPNTIERAINVGASLCDMYKLDAIDDQIRHYDVTGKICPKPWVDNPELFKDFKEKVSVAMSAKLDEYVASHTVSILQWYHGQMKGNTDVQNFTHWLANEIRKAAGLPEE